MKLPEIGAGSLLAVLSAVACPGARKTCFDCFRQWLFFAGIRMAALAELSPQEAGREVISNLLVFPHQICMKFENPLDSKLYKKILKRLWMKQNEQADLWVVLLQKNLADWLCQVESFWCIRLGSFLIPHGAKDGIATLHTWELVCLCGTYLHTCHF